MAPIDPDAHFLLTDGGLYTAASLGEPLTPGTWGVVLRVRSGAYGYFMSYSNGGLSSGYGIRVLSATSFRAYVGASGVRYSPTYDGTSIIDDGKFHAFVGTYDGNTIRLYVDGVEVGIGVAVGIAQVAPSGSDRLSLGGYGSGFNPNSDLMGAAMSSDTLSLPQITSWLSDVKANVDVVAMPGATSYTYSVQRGAQGAPAQWSPEDNGVVLSKQNNPATSTDTTPVWGF